MESSFNTFCQDESQKPIILVSEIDVVCQNQQDSQNSSLDFQLLAELQQEQIKINVTSRQRNTSLSVRNQNSRAQMTEQKKITKNFLLFDDEGPKQTETVKRSYSKPRAVTKGLFDQNNNQTSLSYYLKSLPSNRRFDQQQAQQRQQAAMQQGNIVETIRSAFVTRPPKHRNNQEQFPCSKFFQTDENFLMEDKQEHTDRKTPAAPLDTQKHSRYNSLNNFEHLELSEVHQEKESIQIDCISNQSRRFIRDGYEVFVEGIYIVNGKKKRKVKKKKIRQQETWQNVKNVPIVDIDKEMAALETLQKQTQEMIQNHQKKTVAAQIGQAQILKIEPKRPQEKQKIQVIAQNQIIKNIVKPVHKLLINRAEESKEIVTDRSIAVTDRTSFKDPTLGLVTSARGLTINNVADQMFGGDQRYVLHRLIFRKEFTTLLKIFKSNVLSSEVIDQQDHQGNTVIVLAAKLAANDVEYIKCIHFLFKYGCNGKIRDRNGWSLMDEAICQPNPRMLAMAFECLNAVQKEKINRNKLRLLSRLELIPDFYTEIHWECQSSWIPFLNKLAPSDTFQIWKIGNSVRVDFTLVGFKQLQNKRRRMRVVFRDGQKAKDKYQGTDTLMVNQDRSIVLNPMEDLDEEEKLAVLTDMMSSSPVSNKVDIVKQSWQQHFDFWGLPIQENLNGYDCTRFKLNVDAHVKRKLKIKKKFTQTYEQYFQNCDVIQPQDPQQIKVTKDQLKHIECQLWLSQMFPLSFQQFLEVMDTLCVSGHQSLEKFHEFLQNESLRQAAFENGFPVKIKVPIDWSIAAEATFIRFQFLEYADDDYIRDTFAIPEDCRFVSRKEGMKTMQSKKKRLAAANFAI